NLFKTITNSGSFKTVGISNGGQIAFAKTEDGKLNAYLIPVSNSIVCSTPVYDPANPQDITVNITGSAINTIKNGSSSLTSWDYSVSGNIVTIKKSYLTYFFNKFNSPDQTLYLTFDFSIGNDPVLEIRVQAH
ncbi:MAG TPA: X2-like carbohydrate binding domain-containing protein, partial [Clostridia bacterium]